MKEFIEKYQEIFPLFEKHGFKTPTLYKNPEEPDTDEVKILIESIFTAENEPKGRPLRKLDLKDDLCKYIKCKFRLVTADYVHASEMKALNETNSINLTSDLSSQELEKRLVDIFGKEWIFGKSTLVSSQESTSPFWDRKESVPVGQSALEYLNKKAVEALQQNPSMANAGFDEQLSYLLSCFNKITPKRAGSPKVK